MSRGSRRLVLPILLLSLLCLGAAAHAQITPPSADFDALPSGPYLDPLVSGTPDDMQVLPISNLMTLYPLVVPPGASGKALRVDNSSSPSNADVLLRFAYDCGSSDQSAGCRISYGFVGWTFTDGRGIEVYIDDDGSYTTPDFTWYGSLTGGAVEDGISSTTFQDAINCSAAHTLDIVVQGGAFLIIDDVLAECLAPIPNQAPQFGMLKAWFE
jgi:hypothetical protein